MKSFNHTYTDEISLAEFANEHHSIISSSTDVLITLYSGYLDIDLNKKVLSQIKENFPTAKIGGATSAGEISGKSVGTEGILISLHVFNKTQVQSQYIKQQAVEDMVEEIKALVNERTKGLLLFPVVVSSYFDIELFLELIYGNHPDLPVFGGAAGENGTFTKQFCFHSDEIHDNGISFVTFDSDDLIIQTDYSFNWEPVGQEFTITKAHNNIVKTIDNKPAAKVVEEYLGPQVKMLMPEMGMEFPFVFEKQGVLIARVILGFEGDHVVLAAPVEEGTVFQFSFGSRKRAIAYSHALSCKYANENVETIMAFSCIARLNFLQSDAQMELSNLSDDSLISGFFTYGEIYHSEKSNYYLNETLTLAFFSENRESIKIPNNFPRAVEVIEQDKSDARLSILTHLVGKVTRELENKNDQLNNNNRILREYSKVIDDRNIEISQSLRYASKLQNSIVFQEEEFDRVFEEHFILFKPKEQVSGDFYFIRDLGDKVVLAVADGTGHGVPGAFISILGVQIMHSITRRMRIGRENLNAGEFLNALRDKMKKVLDRNRITKFSTDGLDISLIILDKETKKIEFSGANQCVLVCTDNETIQLKGDRMPVGAFINERSFSNTTITLEENSKIFMYTDGFADQFGGHRGKKIHSAQLRKMIREHYPKPLGEMKTELDDHFEQWKAGWEQTDDVLMIGFNV